MCLGNCNDLLTLPSVSASVTNGVDGANAYLYAISADSSDNGATFTNHTYPASSSQAWRAFLTTTTALSSPLSDLSLYTGKWFKAVGTDGTNGTNGLFGGISFEYKFGAAGFIGNPGTGFLNLNTTNMSTATVLSVSNLDVNSNSTAALVLAMMSSTSTNIAYIKITKKTDSSKFVTFSVQSYAAGAYESFLITPLSYSSTTPFVQSDAIIITFDSNGDKGTTGTGTTGARLARPVVYQWAASTPAAPSGTSTFTWATGATTLPSTPGSWTLAVGAPTSTAHNLYTAKQFFTDSLTSATSTITWSSVTVAQESGIGAGYTATSTSSNAITNTGSITFTTQAGLAYTVGARVRATETASNLYMEGVVTAYSTTTGVMVFTADKCKSDTPVVGPFTVWNINLAGDFGTVATTDILTNIIKIGNPGMLTLNSVPVQIIPAPAAFYYIEIITASAIITGPVNPITAFSTTNIIDFIGATSGVVYASISASILAETVIPKVYTAVVPVNAASTKIAFAEDINIKSRTANLTVGNGQMEFRVTYAVRGMI